MCSSDLDFLITMGASVQQFFADHGATGEVSVMPGGFDEVVFCPSNETATFDLVTVGRLSPVKRIDRLINAEIGRASCRERV